MYPVKFVADISYLRVAVWIFQLRQNGLAIVAQFPLLGSVSVARRQIVDRGPHFVSFKADPWIVPFRAGSFLLKPFTGHPEIVVALGEFEPVTKG